LVPALALLRERRWVNGQPVSRNEESLKSALSTGTERATGLAAITTTTTMMATMIVVVATAAVATTTELE
jgi:hypothetical protein